MKPLWFALALTLFATEAGAQHSSYASVECRDAAGNLVVTESVDVLEEHLRVRPSEYFRVVDDLSDRVYFSFGPLWCLAVRSEPPAE